MVTRDQVIWLLLLVVVSSCSAGHRNKRSGFKSLFSSSTVSTPSPYPIWKVHRYTGIQLQPLTHTNTHHRKPHEGGVAPSIIDLPDYSEVGGGEEEESPSTISSLVSLLTLIPGGLTGLIASSQGSGREERNEKAEDRIGLALKKDLLLAALQKKKNLFSALTRDAIQLALKKKQATKGWVLDSLLGPSHGGSGVYYNVPLHYPKKSGLLSHLPLVGHFFGSGEGLHLPEVHLPSIPKVISVRDPPHLPIINLHGKYHSPYQTGSYVKVEFPGSKKPLLPSQAEYEVPGTSYATPEKPVPVPQTPLLGQHSPFFPTDQIIAEKTTTRPPFLPSITTTKPEIIAPQVYPYSPESVELPVAAQFPNPAPGETVFPISVQSFPYPPSSYPYPHGDYYHTSESELNPLKITPVYRHSEDTEREPEGENELEDRQDTFHEEPATVEAINEDEEEKETLVVESR